MKNLLKQLFCDHRFELILSTSCDLTRYKESGEKHKFSLKHRIRSYSCNRCKKVKQEEDYISI